MANISNVKDLLHLLGNIGPTADPITALEQQGHTFSTAVKARLKAGCKPTPAQERIWRQAAAKAGKSLITVGQHPTLAPRALSPNEFEFSAGPRMPVANEILPACMRMEPFPMNCFSMNFSPPVTSIHSRACSSWIVPAAASADFRSLVHPPSRRSAKALIDVTFPADDDALNQFHATR